MARSASLYASYDAGILVYMAHLKKVTVLVPEELLRRARRTSREGITSTIRKGLELVAAGRVYEEVRKLRGKVKLDIDLDRLREDRR